MGRSGRVLAAAVVLAIAGAGAGRADDGHAPWAGGASVETPFEAYAAQLAGAVAGRPVRVDCNDGRGWAALARQYAFAPTDVWGFVVFGGSGAGDAMELAPAPCRALDDYWHAPAAAKGRICRYAQPPYASVCPGYRQRLLALQTISHESQHLAGVRDEGAAECNGLQKLAWFAVRFGATPAQAAAMARDYYRHVYLVVRVGTPYFRPDCPEPAG